MSIDMSQFYQVFFEESQEHLASMETLLLELDIRNPDAEQLNAIFRAAHSIKGSAGTFGFTDLAEVTHILENLLDRIRKGELALRPEMIDAFLDAGDVLKELLEAHRGNGAADPGLVATMCKRLSELTMSAAVPAPVIAVSAVETGVPTMLARPEGLDVSFVLDMDADAAAATIDNLVAELGQQWGVAVTGRASAADAPWHLRIAADADMETVRGMLEFIARSDSIRIEPSGSTTPTADSGEDAYGFFDDVSSAASVEAHESWGLFSDASAEAETASPAGGDSYGFFVDLPAPASADAAPSASSLAAEAGSEGDGFGFFVDVPAAVVTPPSPLPAGADTAMELPPPPAKPVADRRATPRGGAGMETSIRVDVDKVDQLINLIGELVITQAMLAQSASDIDPVKYERLHNGLAQLERNTRDMQESVMSIRMLPMSMVFSRFPRVVRDLAGKLNKQVEMKTIGDNTELDKGLIEKITDPLTHLVRNSLDHGIETPDKRIAAGKNPKGTLTLKASHQGGNVVIEVMDDGGGLNRERILEKAREKGLPVSDVISDYEVWQLIFAPGFSTADVVTDVSGRGVGMDVVKRNIEGLGGRVELESSPGFGTRTVIRLPLTLAILDGMSVGVGGETFIIPITTVIESLQPNLDDIRTLAGDSRMVHIRGEYLPFISLAEAFGLDGIQDITKGLLVVVEAEEGKAALFVDELLGQQQVVIKSLEANYRKVNGISGATIMGDGRVAMIIDISAVTRMGLSHTRRRMAA